MRLPRAVTTHTDRYDDSALAASIDETPSGLLLHGIMSSIAEFYSRNLANEVIKGSVQKAKNGGSVAVGDGPGAYRAHGAVERDRPRQNVLVFGRQVGLLEVRNARHGVVVLRA